MIYIEGAAGLSVIYIEGTGGLFMIYIAGTGILTVGAGLVKSRGREVKGREYLGPIFPVPLSHYSRTGSDRIST